MLVRMHHDPVEFLELVEPFLLEREVENSLPLGIARSFADQRMHDGLMFSIESGPGVVAVALKSPKRNLVMTHAPVNATIALARFLFEYGLPVPGVVGPNAAVHPFIDEWVLLNGCNTHVRMALRLYALSRVKDVPLPPGQFRLARLSDIDTIELMTMKFIAEATNDPQDDIRKRCMERIGAAQVGVWDNAGLIVSMTEAVSRTEHLSHIRAVYTPPAHRRKGYATALVARMSARELAAGKKCCTLYTDLSNSTSNKIYQQIGYEIVGDATEVIFE